MSSKQVLFANRVHQMFVPEELRKSQENLDVELAKDEPATPELLVMIDYAFHSGDEDYDGGLSFFNRLHNKLSRFYKLFWEPDTIKKTIHSEEVYMAVVRSLLDGDKVVTYGV